MRASWLGFGAGLGLGERGDGIFGRLVWGRHLRKVHKPGMRGTDWVFVGARSLADGALVADWVVGVAFSIEKISLLGFRTFWMFRPFSFHFLTKSGCME